MCFLFASFSFAFRWNGLALFESHVRTIHCSQFAFFFLCGFLRQRRTVCSGSPFFSSVLPCGNYFTCELLRMEPVAQLTIPIATKHSILQTHICEPDQLLLFLCQFGWFEIKNSAASLRSNQFEKPCFQDRTDCSGTWNTKGIEPIRPLLELN